MVQRFAGAIRQSFDEVFDGQRTGRYSLKQLSKVEKTYIGTKVEILVQAEFGLQRGHRMDYLVAGEEVDAKWSMTSGAWMIPREAVGELCLCMTADDERSIFSVGIIRADDLHLGSKGNQDRKRRLNALGLKAMHWLERNGQLPENLLLNLGKETRSAILDEELSGQERVNQLFRLVQDRLVRREVVLTVARQDDGPKRVRDARKLLQPEGIVILGHQGNHPRIAQVLGLSIPPKGSWVAVRLAPAARAEPDTVEIGSGQWRLARETEPMHPGPIDYQ
ncbi:NaeI family type II restriction endonuclease [Candidatus Poriferisocius sp.]|uniref:NaeI family type II restriction endonuclease n=1 Tax=Candidatus Poriferisocius sp. TaxID=3101276 RepID=UPI003B58D325